MFNAACGDSAWALRPRAAGEKPLFEGQQLRLRQREEVLIKYGVYTPGELKSKKEWFARFRSGQERAGLDAYQLISVWQYMILTNLNESHDFFGVFLPFERINGIITAEILKNDNKAEIAGLYLGFLHAWTSRINAEDKVDSIRKNHLITPTARVLDAGCGDGKVIIKLAQQFPSGVFVGMDASASAISKAIDELEKMGQAAPGNVRFHVRDCRKQPDGQAVPNRGIQPLYPAGYFDLTLLFEGVTDDADYPDYDDPEDWESELCDELIRATRKNGGTIASLGHELENVFTRLLNGNATRRTAPFYIRGTKYDFIDLPWSSRHHDMGDAVFFNIYKFKPGTFPGGTPYRDINACI